MWYLTSLASAKDKYSRKDGDTSWRPDLHADWWISCQLGLDDYSATPLWRFCSPQPSTISGADQGTSHVCYHHGSFGPLHTVVQKNLFHTNALALPLVAVRDWVHPPLMTPSSKCCSITNSLTKFTLANHRDPISAGFGFFRDGYEHWIFNLLQWRQILNQILDFVWDKEIRLGLKATAWHGNTSLFFWWEYPITSNLQGLWYISTEVQLFVLIYKRTAIIQNT